MTLPTFLVIGAGKSGTTSLRHYLSQHPQVFVSPKSLGCFFAFEGWAPAHKGPSDWNLDRWAITDFEHYEAQFDGVEDETAIGEVCAAYLYQDKAAERIKARLPDVKLVAILRHPVDRTYSSYLHNVRDGVEPLTSFAEALAAEPGRIRDGWRYTWHYGARSLYLQQLRRYYDLFAREQVAVYLFDDLCDRPQALLQNLFGFLGVDQDFQPDIRTRFQVTGIPRNRALGELIRRPSLFKSVYSALVPVGPRQRLTKSLEALNLRKPAMAEPLRQELLAVCREDVLGLQDLIGRDLSHWLR